MRIVSEEEFSERLKDQLFGNNCKCVVGKGRSGAIASVYASHYLGIPFIPYGEKVPDKLHPILIIDTARKSGATLRKAQQKYGDDSQVVWLYNEPPRVRFWYEFLKE